MKGKNCISTTNRISKYKQFFTQKKIYIAPFRMDFIACVMEWYSNRNNFLIELQRSDLLSVGSLCSHVHTFQQ